MSYIPHTEKDIHDMLSQIGFSSVKELFSDIPKGLLLKESLNLPTGISEQEVLGKLKSLSKKNRSGDISFLGGGVYRHYIPSPVNHIISRSEFYSAYTPYQPEISQGTLQAMFEFQSLICQLTGMDISNASMYDGASATAEAVLMAKRITKKTGVALSHALHPEYRDVIKTYLSVDGNNIAKIPYCTKTGRTLPEKVETIINKDTSCVVLQQPNFFGCIEEDIKAIAELVHNKGALLIVSITEPLSLGLLKPPGELGADIVTGEGQSFGLPVSFGGPYLGFFAVKEKYLRQMPGRIVGETVDNKGERAYVLTIATREQHIRRGKATSNICSNEGLCAFAATVYLCLLGKKGFKELALLNLHKAEYAKRELSKIPGIKIRFLSPIFNEFVIDTGGKSKKTVQYSDGKALYQGIPLGGFYRELKNSLLISVTELNSKEEIDILANTFKKS